MADGHVIFLIIEQKSISQNEVFFFQLFFSFKTYYLEVEPSNNTINFYFINTANKFYKKIFKYSKEHNNFKMNSDNLFDLPVEVKNLDIVFMKRVPNFFFFLLYDSFKNNIYICVVQSNNSKNIRSFFRYQISRNNVSYFIFESRDPNIFYINSNDSIQLYEIKFSKYSSIDLYSPVKIKSPLKFQIIAKNDFYSKDISVIKNPPRLKWNLLSFILQVRSEMKQNYLLLIILFVFIFLAIYQLIFKKHYLNTNIIDMDFRNKEQQKKL